MSTAPGGVDRERYRLSEDQNERIFQSFIVPDELEPLPSQAHPAVVFIAGQTGAGKTATTRLIKQVMDRRGGSVNINLDFYKPYHPRYAELRADDDQTAGKYTSADGRAWMAKAEAYAVQHQIDVVMETAMRQPSEFAEPAARFRQAGYRAEVVILAVPAALSRLGVLARYWQETQRYGHGRMINIAVHDACYHGVLHEAGAIDAGAVSVDAVAVFRRGNEALYSNRRAADGAWDRSPAAAEAVRGERTRRWTPEESTRFARALARLRGQLGAEWSAQLDDIADLAHPLLFQGPTPAPIAALQVSTEPDGLGPARDLGLA